MRCSLLVSIALVFFSPSVATARLTPTDPVVEKGYVTPFSQRAEPPYCGGVYHPFTIPPLQYDHKYLQGANAGIPSDELPKALVSYRSYFVKLLGESKAREVSLVLVVVVAYNCFDIKMYFGYVPKGKLYPIDKN